MKVESKVSPYKNNLNLIVKDLDFVDLGELPYVKDVVLSTV